MTTRNRLDRTKVESDGRTCKRKSHVPSLYGGISKIPRTMVSHLEQIRQNGPVRLRPDFRAAVSLKNRLHRESGEQVAEPISPQQYRRWHFPQAIHDGTRLNGVGGAQFFFLVTSFLLQLVFFTVDGVPL